VTTATEDEQQQDQQEQGETVAGAMEKREPEGRVSVSGGGILAVTPEQEWWNKAQLAGLRQLGIDKAPPGDSMVFLHYCQKTQLDPFARQIHMIKRTQWDPDSNSWQPKWTIQVGIDGFRTIRDRAERRDHVRVEFEETIWYDEKGGEHTVWLWSDRVPAACKVVLVKHTPEGHVLRFPAVLRTDAYIARTKKGEPAAQWKTQADHMVEKCCEAFASRRAFPQDLGGVYIAEEMQQGDYQPPEPQRAAGRRRPQEPATVAGQAEPAGEPQAPEEAGPGSGLGRPGRLPPQDHPEPGPQDDPAFDRAAAMRDYRRLFGIAGMNRKTDDLTRLRVTEILAEPDQAISNPGWLETSKDLTDDQLRAVCAMLGRLAEGADEIPMRERLEGLVKAADDQVAKRAGVRSDDEGEPVL